MQPMTTPDLDHNITYQGVQTTQIRALQSTMKIQHHRNQQAPQGPQIRVTCLLPRLKQVMHPGRDRTTVLIATKLALTRQDSRAMNASISEAEVI